MKEEKLTIDGIELAFQPGKTILQHAREGGISIPNLCYTSHLTPLASCRICVVEEEKSGRLLASCVTPANAGMSLQTRSEQVLEARRNIVRLLMASHPEACVICDKGNRCQLRSLATELSVGLTDLDRIAIMPGPQEINEYLERDLSKCVMCGRCIKACHELVLEGVLDYFQRGFDTKPATALERTLAESGCTFCGTCVALCPTGALKTKGRAFHGTVSTVEPSLCSDCGCGCALELEIRNDRIIGVGNEGSLPEYSPAICVKGRYGFDRRVSAERLTRPMIAKNGALVACSWEEALDRAAQGLRDIKQTHLPQALGVIGSGRSSCEENYLVQKFARMVLGTNNLDHLYRPMMFQSAKGLEVRFSLSRNRMSAHEIEQCNTLLVLGGDPTKLAPVVGYHLKRAVRQQGAQLVLVDGELAPLDRYAALKLTPRKGTAGLMLAGWARAMAESRLSGPGKSADDWDALDILKGLPMDLTLERVQAQCGVSAEELNRVLDLLLDATGVGIIYGPGLGVIRQTDLSPSSFEELADYLSLLGAMGAGLFAVGVGCNSRGACAMGVLPTCLPGYCGVATDDRAVFEKAWQSPLPAQPGLSMDSMLAQARKGALKGMFLVGEGAVAEPAQLDEALAALECLVVVDHFPGTLAKHAQVLLPGASIAEEEGIYVAADGAVRRSESKLPAPGEVRGLSWIVGELSRRLERPITTDIEEVRSEIAKLLPEYEPIFVPGATKRYKNRGKR